MQDTEMQELFARLTAQFEDCAALAAEGQHAGLGQTTAAGLLREISDILKGAEQCLALIGQYRDVWH